MKIGTRLENQFAIENTNNFRFVISFLSPRPPQGAAESGCVSKIQEIRFAPSHPQMMLNCTNSTRTFRTKTSRTMCRAISLPMDGSMVPCPPKPRLITSRFKFLLNTCVNIMPGRDATWPFTIEVP